MVMCPFPVSCVQGSRAADIMPRTRAVQQCKICQEWVSTNHTSRHAERRHSMELTSNVSSRASSPDREMVNDREGVPPVTVDRASARSTPPSLDYVRNAVLCMLRRVTDVNLPALSSYLAKHFPLIPPAWRGSIIVAAFTGAQKAAVSHTDAVLQVDKERSVWARSSLSRWAHGLSAVEPGYVYPSRDSSTSSVNADRYSPVSNFLLDRQVPVGVDSDYVVAQAEAVSQNTSELGHGIITTSANQLDQPIVSLQLTLPSGGPAQPNGPTQFTVPESQVNTSGSQPTELDVPVQPTAPKGAELTSLVCSTRGDNNGGIAKHSAATVSGGDHGSEIVTEPAAGDVCFFSDLLDVEGMEPVLLDDLPQFLSPILTSPGIAEEPTAGMESENPLSDSPAAPRMVDSIPSNVALSENVRLARKKKEHAATGKSPVGNKENLKRGVLETHYSPSRSEDRKQVSPKKARMQSQRGDEGSTSVESYAVSSRKSDWGSFKIPVKPVNRDRQSGYSPSRKEGRDRHSDERSSSKDKTRFEPERRRPERARGGYQAESNRPRYDRAVPSSRRDRAANLTSEERRWLSRMPIAWR